MFALLAPNLARKAVSTSLPAGSQSSRSSKSNIGEISGAVGGTMVIVIVVFLYCRHRARKRVRSYHDLEKAASRGFFTMLFKLKKGHQRSPSQAPLDPFVHDGTEAHEMTRVRGGGRGLIPAQKVTGAQPHQEPAGLTGSILHGHEVPTSRKVTLNSNKSVSRTSTAINSEPGRQDSATTVAGQGETSSPDVDADLRGEVEILRREVGEMENLRREVEEMRMLRGEYDEPPPEYQAPSQDGEQGDEFPGS
ncbi:hypothetical protein GYMLUDRAFT_64969 [Collybiopsis luxurians FD-317 M1]|uniref:Uncharacterized protein n=1 Tax=Collybiopsis luxurians FD-317 M1 TaxID=944289 RepID=A0A0D0BA91_9AGAR|nr:hypothetical protein GYMLUDRAFT_64969 [Collybiopsis luxurians FD-317 M1]